MKLTDMSFDAMTHVISTFAVELEPLLDDDKVMGISVDLKPAKDETKLDYGRRVAKTLLEIITLVSVKYKPAFCRILAAYFQCAEDAVGQMSMKQIIAQVQDSLNDEALLGFFPQLKPFAQAGLSDTLPNQEGLGQKRRLFMFGKNLSKSKSS